MKFHLLNYQRFFVEFPTSATNQHQPTNQPTPHHLFCYKNGLQTPGRNGALSELGRVYVSLGGRRLTGLLWGEQVVVMVGDGKLRGHRKRQYVLEMVTIFYEISFFLIVFSFEKIGKLLFLFYVTCCAHKGPKKGGFQPLKRQIRIVCFSEVKPSKLDLLGRSAFTFAKHRTSKSKFVWQANEYYSSHNHG